MNQPTPSTPDFLKKNNFFKNQTTSWRLTQAAEQFKAMVSSAAEDLKLEILVRDVADPAYAELAASALLLVSRAVPGCVRIYMVWIAEEGDVITPDYFGHLMYSGVDKVMFGDFPEKLEAARKGEVDATVYRHEGSTVLPFNAQITPTTTLNVLKMAAQAVTRPLDDKFEVELPRLTKPDNVRLSIVSVCGGGESVDMLGFPVRDDVVLALMCDPRGHRHALNQSEPTTLLTLTGYIELTPVVVEQPKHPWMDPKKGMMAAFVVSGISSEMPFDSEQLLVMGLDMVTRFMYSGDWARHYRKTPDLSIMLSKNSGDAKDPARLLETLEPGFMVVLDLPTNHTTTQAFCTNALHNIRRGGHDRIRNGYASFLDEYATRDFLSRSNTPSLYPYSDSVIDLYTCTMPAGQEVDVRCISPMFLEALDKDSGASQKMLDSHFVQSPSGTHRSDVPDYKNDRGRLMRAEVVQNYLNQRGGSMGAVHNTVMRAIVSPEMLLNIHRQVLNRIGYVEEKPMPIHAAFDLNHFK